MDFITGILILANWKDNNYNLILVIINQRIIMIYYKPIKVTINALGLAKAIINVVVHHHEVLELIVTYQGLLFISKFWSLLCYFLKIKKKLFIAFYPQIDSQTKRKNSTMEAYLRAFVY